MTGAKTELIKRLIVRHIRDNRLAPGAKLPGQNDMRAMFGCGSATLSAALNELREDGILRVVDKVGVYVTVPDSSPLKGWRVALVTEEIKGNPYMAFLLVFLSQELNRNDCRTQTFIRQALPEGAPGAPDGMRELRHAVKNGDVDAILSFMPFEAADEEFFNRRHVRLAYMELDPEHPWSFGLNMDKIVSESVRIMAEAGVKHMEYAQVNRADRLKDAFEAAAARFAPEVPRRGAVHRIGAGGAERRDSIERMVRVWLDVPPEERPDGVLVLDDIVAWHIIHRLLNVSSWMPKLLTMRNYDINLPVSDCVIGYWRVDIGAYAEFVAKHFMTMLRGGVSGPSVRYLPPFVKNPVAAGPAASERGWWMNPRSGNSGG